MARFQKTHDAKSLEMIEEAIRAAQLARARSLLRQIDLKKLHPEHWVHASEVCRRSGLPQLALRLLGPMVRPQGRATRRASIEERVEYAGALIQMGATREGMLLLKSPDARTEMPVRAMLFQAFAQIKEWDYGAAIHSLEAYLKSPLLDEYPRLIGEVNLLAAAIQEQDFSISRRLIPRLLQATEIPERKRLHLNVLELAAQNAFHRGDYPMARQMLSKAAEKIWDHESLESLFIKKWQALTEAYEKNDPKPIEGLRKRARVILHWESLRDLDLHRALLQKDLHLFEHVYRGTAYPAYRERLRRHFLKSFGTQFCESETFHWLPRLGTYNPPPFNGSSWSITSAENQFRKSGIVHRTLQALSSDFYRPMDTVRLFQAIYPERHYHALHTPALLHQALRRSRRFLESEKLPLEIRCLKGAFYLESRRSNFYIEWNPEKRQGLQSEKVKLLQTLQDNFPKAPFRIDDISTAKKTSRRSLQRHLRELCKAGFLELSGAARATRYRLK